LHPDASGEQTRQSFLRFEITAHVSFAGELFLTQLPDGLVRLLAFRSRVEGHRAPLAKNPIRLYKKQVRVARSDFQRQVEVAGRE
jgi:hypothetical protein